MIYVKDIVNICHGKIIHGKDDISCINFKTDSRLVLKNDVYVGIKGDTYDGNTFYKDAIKNGASVCILDNENVLDGKYEKATIVLVDDTIKALQKLAKYKRSLYDIPVIAITGSVGKTSVKDMVRTVVSTKYNVLATSGNMNNHIGVPLTILGLQDHDALIVEMGMNHMGEIHVLSNIAKPTIGIITNIGTAHIGNLGSRENILKAKMEITDGMTLGTLIINNDNDLLKTVKYDNLITIGIDNTSDYMAHDINDLVFSANFYIGDEYVSIPVGSKAFIYNSLFAYAVGKKLGIEDELIIKALESFKLTPHRLELIEHKDYRIIDDTYNASLDSVNNALSMLSKIDGRKVFIFGDILELNEYAKEIHKEIGKSVIDNNIDVLITVGVNSRETYNIVYDANIEAYHYNNNEEMLHEIDNIIDIGDTILVKGSHGMNLIEVVEHLKNFKQ